MTAMKRSYGILIGSADDEEGGIACLWRRMLLLWGDDVFVEARRTKAGTKDTMKDDTHLLRCLFNAIIWLALG
jgi:hypothetical protein